MVEERLSEKIDDPKIIQLLMKNMVFDPVSHRIAWRMNVDALFNHLEEIISGVSFRWFEDRIPITAYPVTFIRGLESPYILDADIPSVRLIYPESEITDIPDAGHWLHVQQPELFLNAVLNTL